MTSAQEIAGAPKLAAEHRKALECFDEVVRRAGPRGHDVARAR